MRDNDTMAERSNDSMAFGLRFVASEIEGWLKWHKSHRDGEHMTTEDGTHIMALPVPFWPTHGTFTNWIELFREAAQAIEASGQDPKGLDAKHESAVPEGNAP